MIGLVLFGQFIYAITIKGGIITSPDIDKIITDTQLYYLMHIGDGSKTEKYLRIELDDHIGAISFIVPIQDKDNRAGVWNHTIIIPYKDYFILTDPVKQLSAHFVGPMSNPPAKLEPIKIEE